MLCAQSGAYFQLPDRRLQLFCQYSSDFGSLSPMSPQISYSLLRCFLADFLFTFQLAYIPVPGPFGSSPVLLLIRAKLQFSAIFGQFLPRAPRCATLRCVFSFQIFYILYFILLARILDILDQSRLDFCPVQDAVFSSGTPSAAHLVHCPDLLNLSFFTWMSARPWTLWLRWLPVPLYGPCLCC